MKLSIILITRWYAISTVNKGPISVLRSSNTKNRGHSYEHYARQKQMNCILFFLEGLDFFIREEIQIKIRGINRKWEENNKYSAFTAHNWIRRCKGNNSAPQLKFSELMQTRKLNSSGHTYMIWKQEICNNIFLYDGAICCVQVIF